MADKDGRELTLLVKISQWEQPELFARHYQDFKYVSEKYSLGAGGVTFLLNYYDVVSLASFVI